MFFFSNHPLKLFLKNSFFFPDPSQSIDSYEFFSFLFLSFFFYYLYHLPVWDSYEIIEALLS